jgi:OmpA-OmpF porin, OOP family
MKLHKIALYIILSVLLSVSVNAQNAKNTKSQKKQAKKQGKKKNDRDMTYESVWYKYDDDGDGVPNGRDKCPNTPKGEKVTPFGCPFDSDFDGLYDFEDKCPNEAGPKENQGCPYGDRDGDGILDNVDLCPDVKGLPQFKGCPDTDGDGIPDNQDKCPDIPGTWEYKGCKEPPRRIDTDLDGVYDDEDKCPRTKGPRENQGCPVIPQAVKEALKKAFDNLLFETGKDVIMKSSFGSLDELAKIMKQYSEANLRLEGHTDNVGDDDKNMDLSKRRAASVERYLENKGIATERITSEGFGETRPKATNDTPQGRTLNRRVEMIISYE